MASTADSTGFEFRIVLTVSALLQIYAYSGVVLWSLLVGEVNLALSIAVSFLSTLGIIMILTLGEMVKGVMGWRRFPGGRVRVYLSLSALVPLVLVVVYAGVIILQAVSPIDLTKLDPQVRFFSFVVIASLIGFTFMAMDDLLKFRRKGEVPKITSPQGVTRPSQQGGARQASQGGSGAP